ncbi:hypothetical protein Rhow_006866 [Rhodococcus wratislaviensis]|uniref:Uncharacterized protein n=1 Tax=Rhodococcus wratislaviensis TaxID=44752 RepID=A0A402CGQ4_RHOWR|nr:hypothetical protein Rhow_006866 [Rhodococcus wratislaviensis]
MGIGSRGRARRRKPAVHRGPARHRFTARGNSGHSPPEVVQTLLPGQPGQLGRPRHQKPRLAGHFSQLDTPDTRHQQRSATTGKTRLEQTLCSNVFSNQFPVKPVRECPSSGPRTTRSGRPRVPCPHNPLT